MEGWGHVCFPPFTCIRNCEQKTASLPGSFCSSQVALWAVGALKGKICWIMSRHPLYHGVSTCGWAPAPLVSIASVFRSCASVVAGIGPHATWEGSIVPHLPCYLYLTLGSITRCRLTLGWPAAGVSPLCKNEGRYYLLPHSAEWKWELRSNTPCTQRETETGKWFSLRCCGKWWILFRF